MKKRRISLVLVLAMVLSLVLPITAGATDVPEHLSGGRTNPYYHGMIQPELPEVQPQITEAQRKAASYVSEDQAAKQLRDAMVRRESTVTLYIATENFWYVEDSEGYITDNWFDEDFFGRAYSQELAEGLYDGDYLKWSWGRYDWYMETPYANHYIFTVSISYYTTAGEEQQLDQKLRSVVDSLGVKSMTDYDAYETLYDYVTANVTYDYDGLNSFQATQDFRCFTAYKALIQGTAVCQGYATLYYAMCRYAGLPCRVITSEDHAWNIVYLKHIWYNVDSTWDAEMSTWSYFLLGSENFVDNPSHVSEDEYLTTEFQRAYPISSKDYDPGTPFNDVDPSMWSYGEIKEATDRGMFNGVETWMFAPQEPITRAMLVTVLWRQQGKPTGAPVSAFTDLDRSEYYAQAVDWAAENEIVNGTTLTTFEPDGVATREQIVTILFRYMNRLGKDTSLRDSLSSFKDVDRIESYALEPMQWAVGSGIVNGVGDNMLDPKGETLREQIAALMVRLAHKYNL